MELRVSPDELKPIIELVVAELLQRFPTNEQALAYDEARAAELLGVPRASLRDERLRGRILASRVGRRIRYTRQNLLDYLAERPWNVR